MGFFVFINLLFIDERHFACDLKSILSFYRFLDGYLNIVDMFEI